MRERCASTPPPLARNSAASWATNAVAVLTQRPVPRHALFPHVHVHSLFIDTLCTRPSRVRRLQYWYTVESYVLEYLAIFYKDDAAILADDELVDFWQVYTKGTMGPKWKLPPLRLASLAELLTEAIFGVTAGHDIVGQVTAFVDAPDKMPLRLLDGACVADVQTVCGGLNILSATAARVPPLMDDWTHLFKCESWDAATRDEVEAVLRGFQLKLEHLATLITERNAERERHYGRKFEHCNPLHLESSISI